MASTPEIDPLGIFRKNTRIARILYIFTLSILGVLLAGIVIVLSNGDFLPAIFLAASLPFITATLFLIHRQKFESAAVFLSLVLLALLTLVGTIGLGIHHISSLGYTATLIIASLVIRRRTLIVLNLIAVLCIAWLVFGEIAGLYTPVHLVRSVPGDFFSASLIVLLTSGMVRVLTNAVYASNNEVQLELSERKRVEERLAHDAMHDSLTGLPNRSLFHDRLRQRLELARRDPLSLFAVMFIDLDRFKVINDSLGHQIGDKLLVAAAQRLQQCVRSEDTVSRLSGDEFAILLHTFNDTSDVMHVAERIQSALASTSMLPSINRATTASIGIAVFKAEYTQAQEMLRDADTAMYRAKARGGGQNQIFDETMYANALKLIQMETDLKHAVEHAEWSVYYQPIIAIPERKLVGVEALLRWNHPEKGICQPSEFIQVAEETGLIVPIGDFVLREACWQLKAWRATRNPDLWVSINLSARQFQDQLLLQRISKILEETGLPGSCLHLEITESVAMKDLVYTAQVLHEISAMGVQISLDDFGNGYSSLGYLHRFPLKTLKIDRSFVSENGPHSNHRAITSAIISLGHSLNMDVIAEGIETETQLAFLESAACDKIQGFFFSKPLPAGEVEHLL